MLTSANYYKLVLPRYGSGGRVTQLLVPGGWDVASRNMARALAAAWQLDIEQEAAVFHTHEVRRQKYTLCP